MIEDLTLAEYEMVLRQDFAAFMGRCFGDLNPQAAFALNWHHEAIAAKLAAVQQGEIRRTKVPAYGGRVKVCAG